DHFIQHGAETEDVTTSFHFLPLRLFRRHVSERAHDHSGGGERRRKRLGDGGTGRLEEVHSVAPSPRHPVAPSRTPLDQLRQSEIEDLHIAVTDVRMIGRAGGARFLPEPAHAIDVLRVSGGQYFERYLAAELRVMRKVNLPHSAGADRRKRLILSELLARCDVRLSLTRKPARNTLDQRRGGRRQKFFGLLVRDEQRFNLATQFFVARAGLAEILRAFANRPFQSFVIEPADSL